MNETQAFIYKLDELLFRYNQLLTVNYETEFLRYIEVQENKRREITTALEIANSKLKIAKIRLRFEIQKRKKAENERERLSEALKSLNIDKTTISATFQTARSSPPVSISMGENDLDEDNFKTQKLRKHPTSKLSINLSKLKIWETNCSSDKIESLQSLSLDSSQPDENTEKIPLKSNGCGDTFIIDRLPECESEIIEEFPKTDELEEKNKSLLANEMENRDQIKLKNSPSNLTFKNEYVSRRKYFDVTMANSDLKNSNGVQDLVDKNNVETVSRYAPLIPPMIPSIVVRCIDEIEKRGLKEIGIYRMPGIEVEINHVHQTLHKFEEFDLDAFNIHSICAYLKRFLLGVSLIPTVYHDLFIQIVQDNCKDSLYRAISKLPQPNRDTLAYLVVHLRRVINSLTCRMSLLRVSTIFGPIIFGLSSGEKENQLLECHIINVMEEFLLLPCGYWNSFIVVPTPSDTPSKLRNSPSTERIVRKRAKKYFSLATRRKKYFTSPISDKN